MGREFLRDWVWTLCLCRNVTIVNANAEVLQIADYLDSVLELFPYSDGGSETAWIRTYERQWQMEDGELHYQFHIRERVRLPEEGNPMQEMEEQNGIKDK